MTQEEFSRAYANGTFKELLFSEADYKPKLDSEVIEYCSVACHSDNSEYTLNDIERAFKAGAKFSEEYVRYIGNEFFKAIQASQKDTRKLNDNEVSEIANMQKRIDHYEEFLECLQVGLWREQTQIISLHNEIKDHAYDVLWQFLDYVLKCAPNVVRDFNNERYTERNKNSNDKKTTKQINDNDIK